MSARARAIITATVCAGTAVFLAANISQPLRKADLLAALLFGALVALCDLFPIVFGINEYQFSISTIFLTAALLVLPTTAVVDLAVLACLIQAAAVRQEPIRALYNSGAISYTMGTVALVYHTLAGGTPGIQWPAFVVAGAIYFFLDSIPLVILLSEVTGRPWRATASKTSLGTSWQFLALEALGAILAALWSVSPALILLFVLPTLLVRNSYVIAMRRQQETLRSLLAMADSIDKRDPYTFTHSLSVEEYATRLATWMHWDGPELTELSLAARLHDVGKIGIGNEVLLKQGPLTENELAQIQAHPGIGADMLSSYGLFQHGVRYVELHHERYGGGGYPHDLSCDDVPLGAYIVAVADAYDAMTSDRPYRKGLSPRVALAAIEDGAGRQFHPLCAAVFVDRMRALPEDRWVAHQIPTQPALASL